VERKLTVLGVLRGGLCGGGDRRLDDGENLRFGSTGWRGSRRGDRAAAATVVSAAAKPEAELDRRVTPNAVVDEAGVVFQVFAFEMKPKV